MGAFSLSRAAAVSSLSLDKRLAVTNEYAEERSGGYYVTGTRISLDSVVYAFNRGASPEHIPGDFRFWSDWRRFQGALSAGLIPLITPSARHHVLAIICRSKRLDGTSTGALQSLVSVTGTVITCTLPPRMKNKAK